MKKSKAKNNKHTFTDIDKCIEAGKECITLNLEFQDLERIPFTMTLKELHEKTSLSSLKLMGNQIQKLSPRIKIS